MGVLLLLYHVGIVIFNELHDACKHNIYYQFRFKGRNHWNRNLECLYRVSTRCTRGVRVVFSVTRMRSSNSARINKFDLRTEKSCSVHMTVFEIVAGHNVVNWMQLLT